MTHFHAFDLGSASAGPVLLRTCQYRLVSCFLNNAMALLPNMVPNSLADFLVYETI